MTTPIPNPATAFKLGINALQNTASADEEAKRGCKYFLIMNDYAGAGTLKRAHPDAVVMVRRWFNMQRAPTVDEVMYGLEGANHGPLIYTGVNEGDQIGQDAQSLRRRAALDIEVARRIKKINPGAGFYGSSSVIRTTSSLSFTDLTFSAWIKSK